MGTHPIFESDFDCLTEIGDMKIRRRLFAAYKRSDGVNDKCVLKKLKKDERNEKGEFVYRKQNIFNQENFDNTLDYDDIEAGMEIEMWWPYCEDKTKHPLNGRFREAWVISTEEQHDESDDKDETLQDTFKKYHMTSQDYGANCDEDLEQFLKDFSDKSEDEDPEVKAKIRKYSQKMEEVKERIEDKKKKLRKRRENISKAIAWASVLEDKPAETVKKPKIEPKIESD